MRFENRRGESKAFLNTGYYTSTNHKVLFITPLQSLSYSSNFPLFFLYQHSHERASVTILFTEVEDRRKAPMFPLSLFTRTFLPRQRSTCDPLSNCTRSVSRKFSLAGLINLHYSSLLPPLIPVTCVCVYFTVCVWECC